MTTGKPGHWNPLLHIFFLSTLFPTGIWLWPLLFPACIDKYSWVRADPMGIVSGRCFMGVEWEQALQEELRVCVLGCLFISKGQWEWKGNPRHSVLIFSFCLKKSNNYIFLIEGWIIQLISLIPLFPLEGITMNDLCINKGEGEMEGGYEWHISFLVPVKFTELKEIDLVVVGITRYLGWLGFLYVMETVSLSFGGMKRRGVGAAFTLFGEWTLGGGGGKERHWILFLEDLCQQLVLTQEGFS